MKKILLFLFITALAILLVGCGQKEDDTPTVHTHVGGSNTCLSGAVCTECGEEYGTATGHDFSGEYVSDADGHWRICQNGCGTTDTKVEHTGGAATLTEGAKCDVCGTKYGEKLTLTWSVTPSSIPLLIST